MNTRFYNGLILLTNEDKSFTIIKGELEVIADRISYISGTTVGVGGEKLENAKDVVRGVKSNIEFQNEIDLDGNLIMPGFKNAHTHTAMTFLRSFADDMKLQDWLFEQIFPREAKLNADDIYWADILGIMEYLTSGITSNFDMYFFPPMNAKASVDCGFRTVQTSGLNNFGGTVEEMEENYNIINEMSDLSSFIIGFHAEYTTSKEIMEGVSKLANKVKSPIYLHNSETASEVLECKERWGKTPTELMESMGMYTYGGGGYHCVHMAPEDFEIFKKRGLYVVTNPASNLKLASGVAPINKFIQQDIPVAIGTDGPASNNALDMFREMFLTTALAKVREGDAACVPAEEVLYMATCNGAKCMGLECSDRLDVDKKADIICIDLQSPNMQPMNNIVKNIVYSGSKQNVLFTMVNGKMLYEKGKFNIGFDSKEVYSKVNAIINRMK